MKRGSTMLQTATPSNYQPLATRCVKSLSKSGIHDREQFEKRSSNDLAALYPNSVFRSSDAIGWQNVRAIHFRHGSSEMLIPASDEHCMVLNLGTPVFTRVCPGK